MIQTQKIIDVIQAEQKLIDGFLVEPACDNPGHCGIGALLFAAGFSNAALGGIPETIDDWRPHDAATLALREHYGMERYHVYEIVQANEALKAFYEALHDLRVAYRIADVHCIVQVSAMESDGDDVPLMSRYHIGDALKAQAMAAYAYGAEVGAHEAMMNTVLASGRKRAAK